MSVGKTTLQNIVDEGAQVLGRGNCLAKFGHRIQILEVETVQDFVFNKRVEIGEIADHAGTFIYRATDCYLQRVVVAVTIRIIALSVRRLILLFRHRVAVQAMRC